jgi:adenosine deaminase
MVSNSLKFIRDGEHLKEVLTTLWDNGVKFCMNTDNPSMLRTNLAKEIDLCRQYNILDEKQITQTLDWAREASFVDFNRGTNLYL